MISVDKSWTADIEMCMRTARFHGQDLGTSETLSRVAYIAMGLCHFLNAVKNTRSPRKPIAINIARYIVRPNRLNTIIMALSRSSYLLSPLSFDYRPGIATGAQFISNAGYYPVRTIPFTLDMSMKIIYFFLTEYDAP